MSLVELIYLLDPLVLFPFYAIDLLSLLLTPLVFKTDEFDC